MLPGLGLMSEASVGKDLMVCDSVSLGSPARPGGLPVTLTSDNPQLLLSSTPTETGQKIGYDYHPRRQQSYPFLHAVAERRWIGQGYGHRPRPKRAHGECANDTGGSLDWIQNPPR